MTDGDGGEGRVLSAMEKRRELLAQVFYMAEKIKMGKIGAEQYVAYMDERIALFEKIYEIDNILEQSDNKKLLSEGCENFKKKAEEIFNASRAIAYNIIQKDNSHRPDVEKLKKEFQAEFKLMNQGKNLRNLYSDGYADSGNNAFDRRR